MSSLFVPCPNRNLASCVSKLASMLCGGKLIELVPHARVSMNGHFWSWNCFNEEVEIHCFVSMPGMSVSKPFHHRCRPRTCYAVTGALHGLEYFTLRVRDLQPLGLTQYILFIYNLSAHRQVTVLASCSAQIFRAEGPCACPVRIYALCS